MKAFKITNRFLRKVEKDEIYLMIRGENHIQGGYIELIPNLLYFFNEFVVEWERKKKKIGHYWGK